MEENTTYKPWYDLNPSRLEMEKMAMSQLFPKFDLQIVNGHQLRYRGTLVSDKFKRHDGYCVNIDYYNNNLNLGHPFIVISPSSPDFDGLFPKHSPFFDELKNSILCNEAIEIKSIWMENRTASNNSIVTAASLLNRVIKWLIKYEYSISNYRSYFLNKNDFISLKKFDYRSSIYGYYRSYTSVPDYQSARRNIIRQRLIRNKTITITPETDRWYSTTESNEPILKDFLNTFHQFSYKLVEENINFPCGNALRFAIQHNLRMTEPVLYIEGEIIPSHSLNFNTAIKLIYSGVVCNIFIDIDVTKKISAVLGCCPHPLNFDDGHLFTTKPLHPLRILLLLMNWFNDIEDAFSLAANNIKFFEKYNKYSGMRTRYGRYLLKTDNDK